MPAQRESREHESRARLRPCVETRGHVLIATRIHMPEAAAASFRIQAVERALVARHVPVEALTSAPAKDEKVKEERGVRVSRWPVLRDKSGYLRGYLPYLSFDIPLFFRLLFHRRPRVVLVEPPPTTGLVARAALSFRSIPYIWYAPDIWSDAAEATGAPRIVKKVVRWMESFTLSGARSVIAINEEIAERIRALGAKDVRLVPNGIDTATFTQKGPTPTADERARAGVGGTYFLYAGTASEWQGAEVFLEALRSVRRTHPQAQIVFLGQGSAWPMLKEMASRIHKGPDGRTPVVFIPTLPPAQAASWHRGALASLVSIKTGIGYDFAYPTKVLAALSCGCPVLYAGAGPARDDITANDCGSALAYDPKEIAQAMLLALEDTRSSRWNEEEKNRLHRWVEEKRSIRVTGEKAAMILLESFAD